MIENNILSNAPLENVMAYMSGDSKSIVKYEVVESALTDSDGSILMTEDGDEIWGMVKVKVSNKQ